MKRRSFLALGPALALSPSPERMVTVFKTPALGPTVGVFMPALGEDDESFRRRVRAYFKELRRTAYISRSRPSVPPSRPSTAPTPTEHSTATNDRPNAGLAPAERPDPMASKQTSSRVSTIAAHGLRGGRLTKRQVQIVCASVLAQDETPGQPRKPKAKKRAARAAKAGG